MAASDQKSMDNIERKRVQLDENVTKLRKALKHWQTWELEYGFFQEEIESAGSPSSSAMLQIARQLDGELLNEKEAQDLIGKDSKRTANQVVDMISRRIDYVQQNISTVEKQLDTAEKQLAGASVLVDPDTENEEGLPLMDIVEELDDDGNVVASEIMQPGKVAPEIIEALRKTGIERAKQQENSLASDDASEKPKNTSSSATEPTAPVSTNVSTVSISSIKEKSAEAPAKKKSVTFSDDTKPDPTTSQLSSLEVNGYNEELADFNFTQGSKVIEVDDDWNEIASYPVVPQGDTPEEADLRRQMLQYGLSEVGNIVAEIDLEGREGDNSDDAMDDDFDESYDSDEENDEDQYGRSTKREVSDDYRQQMLELEQKLNARMVENVGPRPDLHPLAEYSDDVRTLRVRKDDANIPSDGHDSSAPKKKGVRFAESLDVSDAPRSNEERTHLTPTSTTTISDTIVERASTDGQPPADFLKPAKVSRFKSSRSTSTQPKSPPTMLPTPTVPEPQPFPEGPKGRTLASTIVERDLQPSEVLPPDEFDPAVINREVQVQYHKMRNKMIQQQGGFQPSQEDENAPLVEEKDGKTQKVSRFKAARLRAEAS